MPGDYAPSYFWKQIYGRYRGTWESATALWGITFLGLSPLASLAVFGVFLLALLLRENLASAARRSRVKKVLTCELCGAPACKKCIRGPYCPTCYEALRTVKGEQKRQAEKIRLRVRKRRRESWTACILDVLFPGCGMLYEGSVQRRLAPLFVCVTAGLYGLYALILTSVYAYPLWVSKGLFLPVFIVGGLYTAAFVVRGVIISRRTAVSEEM
jgi:hypothetical protein